MVASCLFSGPLRAPLNGGASEAAIKKGNDKLIKLEITKDEADMIIKSLQLTQDLLRAGALALDGLEGKVHFAKFSHDFDIKGD